MQASLIIKKIMAIQLARLLHAASFFSDGVTSRDLAASDPRWGRANLEKTWVKMQKIGSRFIVAIQTRGQIVDSRGEIV